MAEGYSTTRLYRIWAGMKQRCYNSKSPSYKSYGGRGIGICDEWKNDFRAFAEWSLNNGYTDTPENCKVKRKDALSIDRIDNDKGYSPTNCQWITLSENASKRRAFRARYGVQARLFMDWLDDICEKVAKDCFGHFELCAAGRLRNFIAFCIDKKFKVQMILAIKDDDIPKAKNLALNILKTLVDNASIKGA